MSIDENLFEQGWDAAERGAHFDAGKPAAWQDGWDASRQSVLARERGWEQES